MTRREGFFIIRSRDPAGIKVTFFALSAERIKDGEKHQKVIFLAKAAGEPAGIKGNLFQSDSCEEQGWATCNGRRLPGTHSKCELLLNFRIGCKLIIEQMFLIFNSLAGKNQGFHKVAGFVKASA